MSMKQIPKEIRTLIAAQYAYGLWNCIYICKTRKKETATATAAAPRSRKQRFSQMLFSWSRYVSYVYCWLAQVLFSENMFFNALYWTGKKTLWEFIDSYLLPATCLHQDLCAGAQFRSFSVRVASTRAPISSKDDGQPIDSWWFYQLIRWISYMIGLHLTWKLLLFCT